MHHSSPAAAASPDLLHLQDLCQPVSDLPVQSPLELGPAPGDIENAYQNHCQDHMETLYNVDIVLLYIPRKMLKLLATINTLKYEDKRIQIEAQKIPNRQSKVL